MSSLEDSMRSLSLDYLNLLINGRAFSDVTFSVQGCLVHAHRCILAARSLFFRKFFCAPEQPSGASPGGYSGPSCGRWPVGQGRGVIPVNSVGYEVFLLLLRFMYSGQVFIVPQKREPRPNYGERGCWHTPPPLPLSSSIYLPPPRRKSPPLNQNSLNTTTCNAPN